MSFTEHLSPGPHADDKPPVESNMGGFYTTTVEIPPELRKPAMRAVAGRARNAEDDRDLLEHLGLLEPLTPSPLWRRANTPKAES